MNSYLKEYKEFLNLSDEEFESFVYSGSLTHDIMITEKKFGFDFSINAFKFRDYAVKKYAWAIPDDKAIQIIRKYGEDGILDFGAGTGYWSVMIDTPKTRVTAVDVHDYEKKYYPVQIGDQNSFNNIECTLFLCWPPYDNSMAFDIAEKHIGRYLIYIGEEDGCTADRQFRILLDKKYRLVEEYRIPHFRYIYDKLFVYDNIAANN